MTGSGIDTEKLSGVLRDARAEADLRTYFGVGLANDQLPQYTGGRFEFLAGGGDHPSVRDAFTPADLVAVGMLGVRVPGPVALELLEGPLGRAAADYLREIPSNVPLWTDGAVSLIVRDSPANKLWHLLRHQGQKGVGWVIAGKLLARKRPALLPVYDDIVRCALGRPPNFWTALRDALRRDDFRLLEDIRAIKSASEIPAEVTELRTLDVAV